MMKKVYSQVSRIILCFVVWLSPMIHVQEIPHNQLFQKSEKQQTLSDSVILRAPWPAGIVWHAGSDGSFYDDCDRSQNKYHCTYDRYAIDLNGNPSTSKETNDDGVLVVAAADGIVREAKNRGDGYGWNVVIGHGNGYETRYAHMRANELLVSENEYVTYGTPLGYVNQTGGTSTGIHLHFVTYYCDPNRPANECKILSNLSPVKPEPLGDKNTISDGDQITSNNFSVGYEKFDPKASVDVLEQKKHESFIKTYTMFGGGYVFGPPESYITKYSTSSHLFQRYDKNYTDYLPWSGMKSALFENGGIAYMLMDPLLSHYDSLGGPSASLGLPVTHTYDWDVNASGQDIGWRSDFQNGSIVRYRNNTVEELNKNNAPWKTSFYPNYNQFDTPVLTRFDKNVDFEWQVEDTPGDLREYVQLGPSVEMQTVMGSVISAFKLNLELQGKVEIRSGSDLIYSRSSPDAVISDSSSAVIGIGKKEITIRFWQEPGKKARIKVTSGSIITTPAFASEGTAASSAISPGAQVYASYPPPPFPFSSGSTNPPQPGTASASSTVLIFDTSGSMGEADEQGLTKLAAAQAAGENILNIISAENQSQTGTEHEVGVVDYDTTARTDVQITTDAGSWHSAVQSFFPRGSTAMPDGLKTGMDLFANARTGNKQIIILLSDGLPNVGLGTTMVSEDVVRQQVLDLAGQAGSQGICIYTVGFGLRAGTGALVSINEDFLRQVADRSGCGKYFNAQNATELANIYTELRHSSMGNVLLRQAGDIQQGQTIDLGTVNVPQYQSMLLVTLNWPGSKLTNVIKDPSGMTVDQNYPGASISPSRTLESIIINDPMPGDWTYGIVGVDVPEGQTNYFAMISSRLNPNPQPLPTPTPAPAPVSSTSFPLVILAIVLGGSGVAIYTYNTTLQRKRGATVPPGATLTCTAGLSTGQTVALKPSFTIGRGSGCDLVLSDPAVSRLHARIRFAQGGWFIQDQGSQGGTRVNGRMVTAARLNSGDQISIGNTAWVFRL